MSPRGALRSRLHRQSLAGRVIALTTFAVAASVAVVALAAYFTVRHQLQSTLDQSLQRRAAVSAQFDPHEYAFSALPSFMQAAVESQVGYVYSDGRVASSGRGNEQLRLGAPELAVAEGSSSYDCRTVVARNGADYRVVTVPTDTAGTAFFVAQSLEPNEAALDRLGLVLFVFGALGVIAAGLAGWLVARNGLRPVRRLTQAAEEIARTEQLEPIPVEGNDETARLARAFNAMLTALSASRDRQRQLVADAGHELRTPLTSLRTNLELLTQADRRGGLSEASRAELLDDVRFQIEELTTLIGDLTELAREQPAEVLLEQVDLAEVTEHAVERVRRRAPSLQFDLHTQAWWVLGEASALERAVTNLLDNAAKWSPPLGVVTVHLREGELTVDDRGHGISEDDLPHVFDRFYRSKGSRTLPGSGLGLSIVRQVAERHGGSVEAGRSPEGGARFALRLPGSTEPTEPSQGTASDRHGGPHDDGSARSTPRSTPSTSSLSAG